MTVEKNDNLEGAWKLHERVSSQDQFLFVIAY